MIYNRQKVQAAQQVAILLNNDARLKRCSKRQGTMGGPMKKTTQRLF
jgi:hypothetical protein